MVWVVLACSAPPPVRVAEPERSSDVIAADSGADSGGDSGVDTGPLGLGSPCNASANTCADGARRLQQKAKVWKLTWPSAHWPALAC